MKAKASKAWYQGILQILAVSLVSSLSPPSVAAAADPQVANGVTPEVVYYHQDATGNLALVTDESGQVAWRSEVQPFGQGTPSAPDLPLHFLGQPLETQIGSLYHLGARTYDPAAGRFLTTDPVPLIGVMLEEPQRFNRYAYGLNNPLRYMDPTGLAPPGSDGPKRPVKPKLPSIDPVTGKPAGPLPEPKVIDLDPNEGPTERIPWPGTVTEEVTEVGPVRTGQTTPSLGEAPVPEGEFDEQDEKKRLAEDLNRLACTYGMDSCRADPLVWDPIFSPLPGVGALPAGPTVPVRPHVPVVRPGLVRPVLLRPVLVTP